MLRYFFTVVCSSAIIGCSSSSTQDVTDAGQDQGSTILTGVFLDSAVEGLTYNTETITGTTNISGEFEYVSGENVTFSIGDLVFPTIVASGTVTPLDMVESGDLYSNLVVNTTVLLQSLDVDADPTNGIMISAQATENSVSIDLTMPPSEFADNADVLNMVANSGSSNSTLVSTDEASQHFQMTLVDSGDLESFSKLEYTNLMIGSTAVFAEGSSIYYREDRTKFSRRIGGDEFTGTWWLDENGLICEDIRGGQSTYCVADAQNYLLTKNPDSGNDYFYSETGFISGLTVTTGDTLGLSGS